MTERRAGAHAPAEVQEPQAAELLDALVSLVASWSSPVVQGEIATRMGLSINEADVRTLHTIGRFGSLRPAQLAAELYLTRPTTSKSLARLAGAGLIERRSARANCAIDAASPAPGCTSAIARSTMATPAATRRS